MPIKLDIPIPMDLNVLRETLKIFAVGLSDTFHRGRYIVDSEHSNFHCATAVRLKSHPFLLPNRLAANM